MAFFSNAQETYGRYGGYIGEFQEVLGKFEVKFGRPADFLQLAPKLAHDEKFRVEFATLTKSVGQREEGTLTLTRALTIIAISLGGPELEKIEKNAVSISLVSVFLAGLGGWSKAEPALETVAAKATVEPVAMVDPVVRVEQLTTVEPVVAVEPVAMAEALDTVEPVARVDKPIVDKPIKVEKPGSQREESGGWGAIVAALNEGSENEQEEKEALELEQRLSAGPRSDLEGSTTSLFGGTALVKEALSRLEINALELKLHLDSIDHRMERIEPHLDDLTARIGPTVESVPQAETNGRPKALPLQRFSQLEIVEPRTEEHAWVGDGEETAKTDVAGSSIVSKPKGSLQLRRLYWVLAALGVLLLVLAGAAGVFFYRGRRQESGESRVAAAVTAVSARPDGAGAMHGLDPPGRGGGNGAAGPGLKVQESQGATVRQAEKPRVLAVTEQGGQGSSGGPVSGPDRSGPNQTGLNQTGSGNGPQREPRIELGSQPGKIHVAKVEAPPPLVANGSAGAHMTAGLGAIASARSPSVRVAAVPDASVSAAAAKVTPAPAAVPTTTTPVHRAVFVSASALMRYVIVSPKPTYPQVAHFQRTQGDVMVRALISENGRIESATAVSGPTSLQEAAVDAMRGWRYRPYLINGKPVEVQTYVNFHFSMEH